MLAVASRCGRGCVVMSVLNTTSAKPGIRVCSLSTLDWGARGSKGVAWNSVVMMSYSCHLQCCFNVKYYRYVACRHIWAACSILSTWNLTYYPVCAHQLQIIPSYPCNFWCISNVSWHGCARIWRTCMQQPKLNIRLKFHVLFLIQTGLQPKGIQ